MSAVEFRVVDGNDDVIDTCDSHELATRLAETAALRTGGPIRLEARLEFPNGEVLEPVLATCRRLTALSVVWSEATED